MPTTPAQSPTPRATTPAAGIGRGRRAALFTLGLLRSITAEAGGPGLTLDAARPPELRADGRYDIAGFDWEVLPGVVFAMKPGAAPPAGARPLGGRSYLLPTRSPAEAVARALQDQGAMGVEAVFPDVLLERGRSSADWDDPLRGGQWYLDSLEMEALYAVSEGDPSVRIAVIDSGIDVAHPDLAAAVLAPYDAYSDDDDPSPDPGAFCGGASAAICDLHGTAVSGIVLARGDNGVGIVGLCPRCTLVPIKLLGDGAGAMSADIAAFEHAIAQDVSVINNSWGYTRPTAAPGPLASVIARAATEPRGGKGALVVFAAGNDDRELRDDELTGLPGVLCVSAADRYGNPTNYTNRGASVDLAAPSATVSIAPEGGSTETFGGTSAAAPVVSGVAGWALSVQPGLSAAELADLLVSTARPNALVSRDADGHHDIYGYGELDPVALLAALQGEAAEDTGPAPESEPGPAAEAGQPGKSGAGCASTARRPGAGWSFLALLALGRAGSGGPRRRAGS